MKQWPWGIVVRVGRNGGLLVGYAQPRRDRPDLHLLEPSDPPADAASSRPERRWARRTIVTTIFFALTALGYLCALVRVSELDLACQGVREECTKKEAEIGRLAIRHAALTDGGQVERIVRYGGLTPPEQRDQAAVSPELCPCTVPASEEGEVEEAPREVWAGVRRPARW